MQVPVKRLLTPAFFYYLLALEKTFLKGRELPPYLKSTHYTIPAQQLPHYTIPIPAQQLPHYTILAQQLPLVLSIQVRQMLCIVFMLWLLVLNLKAIVFMLWLLVLKTNALCWQTSFPFVPDSLKTIHFVGRTIRFERRQDFVVEIVAGPYPYIEGSEEVLKQLKEVSEEVEAIELKHY
jgi:hypothetical protein